MSVIGRYEGTREYMLFPKETGFGDNQYVTKFDVFKYQELGDHFNDGWRIHDEDKKIEAMNKKASA
ncbi:hypothetical protein [Bacillus sp. FDAARGOS_1420]|uniref:hypothetical protein n=1 Tax=unclassified Bacillus (in: firmicutes) TaxID=185979 RepID=UPI001C5B906F|nr:hypothetical protein [Bacillus sp. FDAARGOS_1420]MBW3496318.1 hypothetical protein [Bacillus sp. FDAARGOS_1420]